MLFILLERTNGDERTLQLAICHSRITGRPVKGLKLFLGPPHLGRDYPVPILVTAGELFHVVMT
jgi:hypothetical protein